MNDDNKWYYLEGEELERFFALREGARPLSEVLEEMGDDVRVRHVGDILTEAPFEGTAREVLEDWVDKEDPPLALVRSDGIYLMHLRTWLIELEFVDEDEEDEP